MEQNMKKHTGRLKNTDQRCVVVFMQIPEDPENALVIPVDSLPPRYERSLMDALESLEGQNETVFANVLHRRHTPDGQNMLTALHNAGMLMPTPVDNVIMMPRPNMPFPLREVITQMGGIVPGVSPDAVPTTTTAEKVKFNPYDRREIELTEESKAIARNLMIEASEFDAIATQKRELAYRHDPSLKPVVPQAFTGQQPAPAPPKKPAPAVVKNKTVAKKKV